MAISLGQDAASISKISFVLGEEVLEANGVIELETVLEEHPDQNLVIIGPDVAMTTATSVASRYRTHRPTVGVLLLRRRIDMQVMAEALRSGIREVVPANDAGELLEAASRSRIISAQLGDSALRQGRSGKIILVFAAKGGCGKTTVSTNLAVTLANQTKSKVCLVDFDLEFGDVAVAFQIDPKKTISDAVPMATTLDQQGMSSLVLPRNEYLDVLLAPRLPADSDDISAELAERVLDVLASMYSYVVVDSPPAFTDVILKAFDMADEYILITTLDMPAVKNLQVTLDTLETLGYDQKKCNVIVNRSTAKAGLKVKDVQELLGTPIVATLPSTNAVPAAINRGKAVVEERPRGSFAASMRKLVQLVDRRGAESGKKSGSERRQKS